MKLKVLIIFLSTSYPLLYEAEGFESFVQYIIPSYMKLRGSIVLFSTSYPLLYEAGGLIVLLCSSYPLLYEAEWF